MTVCDAASGLRGGPFGPLSGAFPRQAGLRGAVAGTVDPMLSKQSTLGILLTLLPACGRGPVSPVVGDGTSSGLASDSGPHDSTSAELSSSGPGWESSTGGGMVSSSTGFESSSGSTTGGESSSGSSGEALDESTSAPWDCVMETEPLRCMCNGVQLPSQEWCGCADHQGLCVCPLATFEEPCP